MKIKVSFFLRNTLRPFSDIYIFSFSSSCMEFHNWPLLRKWLLPLKKRKKCLKHKYTSFEFYHGKLFIYSSTYVLNWYKNKDFFLFDLYLHSLNFILFQKTRFRVLICSSIHSIFSQKKVTTKIGLWTHGIVFFVSFFIYNLSRIYGISK